MIEALLVGRASGAFTGGSDPVTDAESAAREIARAFQCRCSMCRKAYGGSFYIRLPGHSTVFKKMLLEDSNVIAPVLDSFTALNLDEQLQEQVHTLLFIIYFKYVYCYCAHSIKFKVITISLSRIRTVYGENMPHLLRFLLLSTTPANAGRMISQIHDHLKFVGVMDSYSVRNKKLEGIISAQSTEASILDALRSSLRFFILATWVLTSAALLIRIFAYSFDIKAKDCLKRIKMFIYLLKHMFSNLDTEKSGSITYEEPKTGLARLGSKLSENETDVDGNGTVDYIEFTTPTMHKHKLERNDNLCSDFQYFDKDDSM